MSRRLPSAFDLNAVTKHALLGAVLIFAGFCLWWTLAADTRRINEDFFTSALQAAKAPDYRPNQSPEELRTAYALTLARRSPIFGLAGTDPAALAARVGELDETLGKLESMQKNEEEAAMARSLYPVVFLAELAELEARREAFIASGSSVDRERYDKQLARTIDAYENDVLHFKENLERAVPEKNMRIPTFGGTITTDSLLATATGLEDAARAVREEHRRRTRCLNGEIGACDTTRLAMPDLAGTEARPAAIPEIGRDILSLRAEVYGDSYPAGGTLLFSSACLAEEETKPHYAITTPISGFAVWYIGDLFLSPLAESDGSTARYLYEQGIEYSQQNPLNYYTCPDLLHDLGRARAMMDARAFAAESQIATPERDALLSVPLSETAVADYLSAVTDETADTETRTRFTELALSFAARSAGLEFLIADIVRVTNNDMRFAEAGIPYDISASKLYLSHSAFPSLFLVHADAHAKLYEPHTTHDAEEFSRFAVRYSDLRAVVPREKIVASLQAFLRFERILP